ncbi:MAG: hypothetical protein JNL38_37245 [Myxococcales bacterium]|jgi:hypothetical protein|nr:hypothetical protein [Myxococcales bacterium]
MARWLVKASREGELDKGPYDLDALRQSRKRLLLKDDALVREESSDEWVPLKSLFTEEEKAKTRADLGGPSPARVRELDEQAKGSFGLGFAAGLLGGCIGLGIVYAAAKGSETKRGALIGFLVQAGVGLAIRVVAASSSH